MQFVDEVEINAHGGNGGNGAVAFRREKYVPLGGPAGGDGGRGGDVVIEAQTRISTLLDLRYRQTYRAANGENGRGKDQFGAGAKDTVVAVPVGTQVYDAESGALLADLDAPESRFIAARGGRGGRGNIRFATPYDKAPRRSEEGRPGEQRRLRLELKLLADVGVVGFPNVGKSTLISAVSRARPKIADYPFTTLTPNLGVVRLGEERSFVIADIPGIVEGAAQGAGLGLRFLRHIERNRILLHVVTFTHDPDRDPLADYDALLGELGAFSPALAERPMLVGVSKLDLPEVRDGLEELRSGFRDRGIESIHAFSSATREGIPELLASLERLLEAHPRTNVPPAVTLPSAEERPHGDATGFAGDD